MYDTSNVFAKILRGEMPCKKIAEDTYFLSFHDIAPKTPVHALVIPKGAYVTAYDFAKASLEEIHGFWQGVAQTINILNLTNNGYRLITNAGLYGHQEVPHFHMHILSGCDLGAMVQSC